MPGDTIDQPAAWQDRPAVDVTAGRQTKAVAAEMTKAPRPPAQSEMDRFSALLQWSGL